MVLSLLIWFLGESRIRSVDPKIRLRTITRADTGEPIDNQVFYTCLSLNHIFKSLSISHDQATFKRKWYLESQSLDQMLFCLAASSKLASQIRTGCFGNGFLYQSVPDVPLYQLNRILAANSSQRWYDCVISDWEICAQLKPTLGRFFTSLITRYRNDCDKSWNLDSFWIGNKIEFKE